MATSPAKSGLNISGKGSMTVVEGTIGNGNHNKDPHMTNISPVFFWAPAVLLVPTVLVAAYLYFSLKVEIRLVARRTVARSEFDTRWAELVTELETLRARVAVAESPPAPPDFAPQALNLNRRGQILRLHGKGRSVAEIASDLQISQGEVELMVKIHDWSATSVL